MSNKKTIGLIVVGLILSIFFSGCHKNDQQEVPNQVIDGDEKIEFEKEEPVKEEPVKVENNEDEVKSAKIEDVVGLTEEQMQLLKTIAITLEGVNVNIGNYSEDSKYGEFIKVIISKLDDLKEVADYTIEKEDISFNLPYSNYYNQLVKMLFNNTTSKDLYILNEANKDNYIYANIMKNKLYSLTENDLAYIKNINIAVKENRDELIDLYEINIVMNFDLENENNKTSYIAYFGNTNGNYTLLDMGLSKDNFIISKKETNKNDQNIEDGKEAAKANEADKKAEEDAIRKAQEEKAAADKAAKEAAEKAEATNPNKTNPPGVPDWVDTSNWTPTGLNGQLVPPGTGWDGTDMIVPGDGYPGEGVLPESYYCEPTCDSAPYIGDFEGYCYIPYLGYVLYSGGHPADGMEEGVDHRYDPDPGPNLNLD